MITRRQFFQTTLAVNRPPNIVLILADDLGYGDLGCYGGEIPTPNIDRLAATGIRFTQAYVAAPICSPSRVGITTGQFPARHLIFSYLNNRQSQRTLGMSDYLAPQVPTIARALKNRGYATGHFGKWHMGGGRDVDDAPLPQAYGFDESYTSFEGLGDRVLPPGNLSGQSEKLGQGKITRAPKSELTKLFVDRAIGFAERNRDKPFYLQLWPDDVHDPFAPTPDQLAKFAKFSGNKYRQQFFAVLDEMDRQIGRLIDAVQGENTIFVFLGDNGPTAWPRYYNEKLDPPGGTGGLRGRKWSLYEGGIRTPFIVNWKGHTPAGRVNKHTVIAAVDLFPTFCKLAGAPLYPPIPMAKACPTLSSANASKERATCIGSTAAPKMAIPIPASRAIRAPTAPSVAAPGSSSKMPTDQVLNSMTSAARPTKTLQRRTRSRRVDCRRSLLS